MGRVGLALFETPEPSSRGAAPPRSEQEFLWLQVFATLCVISVEALATRVGVSLLKGATRRRLTRAYVRPCVFLGVCLDA